MALLDTLASFHILELMRQMEEPRPDGNLTGTIFHLLDLPSRMFMVHFTYGSGLVLLQEVLMHYMKEEFKAVYTLHRHPGQASHADTPFVG